MIETYLAGLAIVAGIMLLFVFIAAGAHLDFHDEESAGNLKFTLVMLASSVVWPLYPPAAIIAIIYVMCKAIYSLIKGDYR